MATVTLLEKARQRRLNAIASLQTRTQTRNKDNVVSIFDYAFDDSASEDTVEDNIVAFRSTRKALVAANDLQSPERAAA